MIDDTNDQPKRQQKICAHAIIFKVVAHVLFDRNDELAGTHEIPFLVLAKGYASAQEAYLRIHKYFTNETDPLRGAASDKKPDILGSLSLSSLEITNLMEARKKRIRLPQIDECAAIVKLEESGPKPAVYYLLDVTFYSPK